MIKSLWIFCRIVSGIVLSLFLTLAGCYRCIQEPDYGEHFPGLIEKKYYHSEPGRDSVECSIYTYEDTEELREKLENHKKFMPVTKNATEYIASFIEHFGGWAKSEGFYSEYNLDKNSIDSKDYFFIENVETYGGDDPDWIDQYRVYDVYYFDIQSMTLYYLHIDI